MTEPLERLTRDVAHHLGEGPGPIRRARQRAAVARLTRRPPAPPRRVWWLVPLLAAAVLAVFAARGPSSLARPMIATIGQQSVMTGAWLAAPEHEALAIDFSDRSRAVLAPRAAARLTKIEPARIELNLERGTVTLYVHSVPGRAWFVVAGPYTVELTDAEGSATWSPDTRTLVVEVRRGSAAIGGDAHAAHIIAGQRLELRDLPAPTSAPAAPAIVATELPDPTAAPTTAGSSRSSKPPAAGSPPPRRSWIDLAESGDHAAALAAAEREGFSKLLKSLDVAALDLLARSARFAGASTRAREALLALRRRFSADPRARTAAFLLGRIALDLDGDPPRAREFFSNYLSEAPDGPLAADARRRLTELEHHE